MTDIQTVHTQVQCALNNTVNSWKDRCNEK